jgi:predicted NAD-dependent protein-ADP-ribosyltransferase YbiA (DUF1768 family)
MKLCRYLVLLGLVCSIGCDPKQGSKTAPSIPTTNQKTSEPTTNQKTSEPTTNQKTSEPTTNQKTSEEEANKLIAWFSTNEKAYNLGVVGQADAPIWEGTDANKQLNIFAEQLDDTRGEISAVMALANKYLPDPSLKKFTIYKFYDKKDDGAAFANTYEAKREFSYRDVKSKFAELFFQGEKIFDHSYKDPATKKDYDSFQDAFNAVEGLKNQVSSWGEFPQKVKDYMKKNQHDPNYWQNWDKQKIAVMSRVHAARFKGEPELFLKLITTRGQSVIIENSQYDDKWGRGKNNDGTNMLGLLYMVHRQRFWSDFKKDKKVNFDSSNVDHVMYMLTWINNYDGGTKNT